MILAVPALEFHPANATILRFLHPAIELERIGLAQNMKAMFRM